MTIPATWLAGHSTTGGAPRRRSRRTPLRLHSSVWGRAAFVARALCIGGALAAGVAGAAPAPGTAPAPPVLRQTEEAHRGAVPWWDRFPVLVQTGDTEQARRVHATASLCGAADDPTWGLFGQRQSIVNWGDRTAALHAAGIQALIWIEGFGTAGCCYIAQVKRNPGGTWVKDPRDASLTRLFLNHWGWQEFDGTGEIRWVGAHNYFDDEDFARPYTRTHPRYGAPPMTYPDGRRATGYLGPREDPRTSRVWDAGCAKDVLGRVTFEYEYNEAVNRIVRETGAPRGPLTGLLDTGEAPLGVPDPGYTPEEWARLKRRQYSGCFSPGKDSACPAWIDYARASIRQALDAGVDGLWVDNFSPWDSFNGWPVLKAFGEWSVAGFRTYLRTHFPPQRLQAVGITRPDRFDVRAYLRARCRQWGGDPARLDDPRWLDQRWQDDPVWRAYLIYKRQAGTQALSRLYGVIKAEAAAAGKPDFLVSGNDIPGFSLGWVRGDLDMVSTELSWGWGLTTGPRGLMPPPLGSYVPVYKLAREHARSRFVNVWMYVPEGQRGKPNVARVLYAQALANHAGPMPLYPGHTAGNEPTDAAFFAFVRSAGSVLGQREPVETAGLYYSSSSQLIEMLPGGFRNHAAQPHSFSFYGWGTALTWLHVPWRAVPEWKLTPDTLRRLRVLIIPSAEVFPASDAGTLLSWVRNGGRLVIAGACGRRYGEEGNFQRVVTGTTLGPLLTAAQPPEVRRLGRGRVLVLPDDPGLPFYLADRDRPARLPPFARTLAAVCAGVSFPLEADGVPWHVGLTPYQDGARLFVDVNNTALDIERDRITPSPGLRFTCVLPPEARRGRLQARVLAPGAAPEVRLWRVGFDRVQVQLGSVALYACVVIEPERQGPAQSGWPRRP